MTLTLTLTYFWKNLNWLLRGVLVPLGQTPIWFEFFIFFPFLKAQQSPYKWNQAGPYSCRICCLCKIWLMIQGLYAYITLKYSFKNKSSSIGSYYKYFNLYFQIHVCRVALILRDSKVVYSCLRSFKCFKEKKNVYYLNLLKMFWVLLAKFSLPACSIPSMCFIRIKFDWKADFLFHQRLAEWQIRIT